MKRIIVYGSLNEDVTYKVIKHPLPGETIRVQDVHYDFGGKGANQAVAAQRAGSQVLMIGAVGNDVSGKKIINHLKKEGIETDGIEVMEIGTGTAKIILSNSGENIIYIAPGANGTLEFDSKKINLECIDMCEYALFQNEINMESNLLAMKYMFENGIKVIWDPAPYESFDLDFLKYIYCLTPNETELEQLVPNKNTTIERARVLLHYGVEHVLVTLGEKGSLYVNRKSTIRFKSPSVRAVDTVAAGDTFSGYFASFLNQGFKLVESIQLAHKAAAIAVTRYGAQLSIPYKEEVLRFEEGVEYEKIWSFE